MVVALHALVEFFTEIIPVGLALIGPGKILHNSLKLMTEPLLALPCHLLHLGPDIVNLS